jgi:hypothetical protein
MSIPTICPAAKKLVKAAYLYKGGHSEKPPTDYSQPCEECVMELASHVELLCKFPNARWTDAPSTVALSIRAFCIVLNDNCTDEQRQLLKPYALKVLNTLDPSKEQKRAFIFTDAAVRIFTSLAFDAAGLKDKATELRNLPQIVDIKYAEYAVKYAVKYAAEYAESAKYAAEYADIIFKECLKVLDRVIAA